jgi:hypothetical protein
MTNKTLGPCKVRLFDKSGKMLELEGSYGMDGETASLYFNDNSIPPDFEPVRMEVKPIVTSS